jgi:hypothetical protein
LSLIIHLKAVLPLNWPTRDNAKKMMAKVDAFKNELERYRGEDIPEDVVTRVMPYLNDDVSGCTRVHDRLIFILLVQGRLLMVCVVLAVALAGVHVRDHEDQVSGRGQPLQLDRQHRAVQPHIQKGL